jgi:hypothetical protein
VILIERENQKPEIEQMKIAADNMGVPLDMVKIRYGVPDLKTPSQIKHDRLDNLKPESQIVFQDLS